MSKESKYSITKLMSVLFMIIIVCLSVVGCSNTDTDTISSEVEKISESSALISAKPSDEALKNQTDGSYVLESSSEVSMEESSREESSKPDPIVGEISSFSAAKIEKNSVTLNWSICSNVSGYQIHRKADNETAFDEIKMIKGNKIDSYEDNEVKSGERYDYRIRAYILRDGKYYYGKTVATTVTTVLAEVEGLYASSQKSNEVTISWNQVQGASGYIVSKMDSNGGYNEVEIITDKTATDYTDKNLTPATKYGYKVQAYKVIDNEKYYGGANTIVTWTKTKTPKVELSYDKKESKITAKWSEVEGANGYDIYLATMKDGEYKSIGSTDKTEFVTDKVENNNIYYIRVRANFTIDGEKKQSDYETISIECGKVPKVHGYSVGTTYIEISLDKQHMWYYKDGKEIVSTDVVTGMKYSHDTPTGLYYIINKASPARLVGETWDVEVNYWLGVTFDGVGIHDSTWRYSGYGGNIYTYDGSHGCINTPYDQVKKIYDNCKEKTPVVIY